MIKRRFPDSAPLNVVLGHTALRLLDAAASNPQKVIETAVAVGKAYVDHQHHARIGWLTSLTLSTDVMVAKAANELLEALKVSK